METRPRRGEETTTRCPICQRATGRATCPCGYDFEQRDPALAIARLRATRRVARAIAGVGIALWGAIPLSGLLGSGATVVALMAFQLVVGISLTIAGLAIGSGTGKQLRAADALRQLPAARVVLRADVDRHPQSDR